jgi:hypothetical protein
MSEAAELADTAKGYGMTVEDYLRSLVALDKLPDKPSAKVGRPPRPPEELQKREAMRKELVSVKRFIRSYEQSLAEVSNPSQALKARYGLAQVILAEYQAHGSFTPGRWAESFKRHIA